jgi:hypothetical protein
VRRIFTSIVPIAVTFGVGLIIVVSFIPVPLFAGLTPLRVVLINIAVIVAGMALLLGFFRLLNFHLRRVQQRKSGYSLVALIAALAVFVTLVAEQLLKLSGNQDVANLPVSNLIFNSLIAPIQSSLGALLAIFLGVAAVRMAQRRRTWGTLWFLVSAIVVLLTQIPVTPGSILLPIRQFFDALAMGGLRGLLLGVALGTMAVALRVLLMIDRPQSE